MKAMEFLGALQTAYLSPNYYNNKYPYNLGYFDGQRYSFDCWNLIKVVLAGWKPTGVVGSFTKPTVTGDVDGYHLLLACHDRSQDFSKLKTPGTYLYLSTSPHAGVYIGESVVDGKTINVIECTCSWNTRKIVYSYVDQNGNRFNYKGGTQSSRWTDYGLLNYVDYSDVIPELNDAIEAQATSEQTLGIDVSRWQKGFDLNNARREGFDTVIIKAGGADGGYYKDSAFEDFYSQSEKNLGSWKVGAYYFGNAFSYEDAQKEASYFIQYLQGKNIQKVYYDVEGKMLNQGYTHLTEIIKTFCNTLNDAGYICGIYTSESQFNSRFDDSKMEAYPHWVARYSSTAPKLKSGLPIEIWQYGGSVNYLRSPKIAGTTVDQNIVYDWLGRVTEIPMGISGKSINEIALECIDKGMYGTGDTRKASLGSLYRDVQNEINRICEERQNGTYEKSTDQLAVEVLAGLWGNGIIRKAKLGKRYTEVQKRVEEIIKERAEKGKTYVVVKGDTLSKIARLYNTTVKRICEVNGIPNPNLIQVGQHLIIK